MRAWPAVRCPDIGDHYRSEESGVGDEFRGGVDDLAGGLERFGCFCRAGLLGRVERVFELVPSAAQAAEGPQGRAELGPDDFLDDVVAAGGGGAQACCARRATQACRAAS